MKKVLLAVALLLGLGSLAMAKDAPKTKITFGEGTTVIVNGEAVKSGYQLRKGDKVTVKGGSAQLTYQNPKGGEQTRDLEAGSSVSITDVGSGSVAQLLISSPAAGESLATSVLISSLAPALPPPNPSQNTKVAPVSGSAP